MFPTRYTILEDVHKKHGLRADKLAAYFNQGDPRADEAVALFAAMSRKRSVDVLEAALENGIDAVPNAPKALRDFFHEVEYVPPWVNGDLLNLGSRTFQRCGSLAGIVLACSCLPLAYRSGAGSKALAFTGNMLTRALRRLSETNRYVIETCKPGGLKLHGPGWKMTVKVRLMHAHMRRLLRQGRTKPWREHDLGVPVNQVDLAATQMLFCVSLLKHMRRVGFHFLQAESEGVMHLWRYAGHLLGIVPELLCSTETEGRHLQELILDVAGGPDLDSQRLTHSLMVTAIPMMMAAILARLNPFGQTHHQGKLRAPVRFYHKIPELLGLKPRPDIVKELLSRIAYGLSHGILGGPIAIELDYPATFWRHTAPLLLRSLITPVEACRRLIPGGTRLAVLFGSWETQHLMKSGLYARAMSPSPLDKGMAESPAESGAIKNP